MGSHLVSLNFDSARPRMLAAFWDGLFSSPLEMTFVPVPEPKVGKNRLHLDLASESPEHQAEVVERALSHGARHIDIGQGAVPWVVLADPEGNEFCVLEPREQYAGTGAIASILFDAHDPARLAAFWSAALGWDVGVEEPTITGLRPPGARGPWLEFLTTKDEKRHKNRLHLDIAPPEDGDQEAEVRRLCEAGAKVLRSPEDELIWWVLADPEGNEFCVLTPR